MADTTPNANPGASTGAPKVTAEALLQRLEELEGKLKARDEADAQADHADPYYAPMSESARVSQYPEVDGPEDFDLEKAQSEYDKLEDADEDARVLDYRFRAMHDDSYISYSLSTGEKVVKPYKLS